LNEHDGDRRDASCETKCSPRIGCACRTASLHVSSHGVVKSSA
jgi:hypothetical protein